MPFSYRYSDVRHENVTASRVYGAHISTIVRFPGIVIFRNEYKIFFTPQHDVVGGKRRKRRVKKGDKHPNLTFVSKYVWRLCNDDAQSNKPDGSGGRRVCGPYFGGYHIALCKNEQQHKKIGYIKFEITFFVLCLLSYLSPLSLWRTENFTDFPF